MAIKPALRKFNDNEASTNGEMFSNVINQLFLGLYIMQLCLAGIFISVESKTARFACKVQAILMFILFFVTCCFHLAMVRSMKHRLQTVFPHDILKDDRAGDPTVQRQSGASTVPHLLATTDPSETFTEPHSIVGSPEVQIAHIGSSNHPTIPDLRYMTDVGMLARLSEDDRKVDFYFQITLFMKRVSDDLDSEMQRFVLNPFNELHSADGSLNLKKRLLWECSNSVDRVEVGRATGI